MPTYSKELLAKLRLLEEKQNALTAGTGINIDSYTDTISATTITPILNQGVKIATATNENGVSSDLYSPNTMVVEMTQAQYDALSYLDKVNGNAYFITDRPEIRIWIGTESEYQLLPLATRLKDNILFCIREDEEEEE